MHRNPIQDLNELLAREDLLQPLVDHRRQEALDGHLKHVRYGGDIEVVARALDRILDLSRSPVRQPLADPLDLGGEIRVGLFVEGGDRRHDPLVGRQVCEDHVAIDIGGRDLFPRLRPRERPGLARWLGRRVRGRCCGERLVPANGRLRLWHGLRRRSTLPRPRCGSLERRRRRRGWCGRRARLGFLPRCWGRRRGLNRSVGPRARLRGRDHPSAATIFREEPDRHPRRERDAEPGFAAARGEALLRVPPEQLRAGKRTRRANQRQREQVEARRCEARAGDRRLHRFDRIAPRKKRRDVLRPVRQAGQRHGDATDDQHRQEDALPERLHGGNVVGQHRDHEAEPEKRERRQRERHPQIERMPRQRHPDRDGERELEQSRQYHGHVASGHGAGDQTDCPDGRKAIAPPHAPFALRDHGGRQPEARAAEHGHRQELSHVPHQRHGLVAIEDPERKEEDRRKQKAVEQRHRVAEMQAQADAELGEKRGHCVRSRNTSSRVAFCTWSSSGSMPCASSSAVSRAIARLTAAVRNRALAPSHTRS